MSCVVGMEFPVNAAITAGNAAGQPRRRILPERLAARWIKNRPQFPVAAGRAGAALGAGPAAVFAKAGRRFGFNPDAIRRLAGLPFATPMLATGAALASDGLVQHVFALRQAAMLCVAGTTAPPLPIQPLMPFLTL